MVGLRVLVWGWVYLREVMPAFLVGPSGRLLPRGPSTGILEFVGGRPLFLLSTFRISSSLGTGGYWFGG